MRFISPVLLVISIKWIYNVTMTVLYLRILIVLSFFCTVSAAQTNPLDSTNLVNNKTNILDTVEIGNDDFFTPFIQSNELEDSDEDKMVKTQIDERDFASDEFYMRNIDREEFEQERLLMLFVDENKKKKKFKAWVRMKEDEETPF